MAKFDYTEEENLRWSAPRWEKKKTNKPQSLKGFVISNTITVRCSTDDAFRTLNFYNRGNY